MRAVEGGGGRLTGSTPMHLLTCTHCGKGNLAGQVGCTVEPTEVRISP